MSEKVALLHDINRGADALFEAANIEVVRFPKSIKQSELIDLAHEVTALGIRSGPDLPSEVFTDNDSLEVVGCYCVGTNQVKTQDAAEAGIPVFNSAFENTRSVAEYVVGATFSLLRRLHEHSSQMHAGKWTKTDERSYEVLGKTAGIIGYGAIGSQAGSLLEAVGMNVRYYDPDPRFPKQGRAERASSLDELLQSADVVTLHVPGKYAIITSEVIAKMKPGSFLINAARGQVVDETVVLEALKNGQLAGYAGDVFNIEPKSTTEPFESIFRGQPNVLLTPHIGGSTIESQKNIAEATSNRLLGYLATGTTSGAVNVGGIGLGAVEHGTQRILQYHRNVPGAAVEVDAVLARHGVNILRQNLDTKGDVGYVATDVSGDMNGAFEEIQRLSQTIRAKIIPSTQ